MLIVPVQPVPNQTLACTLGGQNVQLNVRQTSTGLYMDVLANNVVIVTSVLCENFNRIVRDLYLGFVGDLLWIDNGAMPVQPSAAASTGTGTGPSSIGGASIAPAAPTEGATSQPSIPTVPGADPVYTGLGIRFSLAYLELADLQGVG